MKELSLHILDIVQNSISAQATVTEISIDENTAENIMRIVIKDNGKGMSEEFLANVRDPFTTTRTTRKVGMGLSLLEAAAVATGGALNVQSKLGVGTVVDVTFAHDHIDRQPLGDMAETIAILLTGNSGVDFVYTHKYNGKEFTLDTRELKQVLGDVPLDSIDVLIWIKEYITENLTEIGL